MDDAMSNLQPIKCIATFFLVDIVISINWNPNFENGWKKLKINFFIDLNAPIQKAWHLARLALILI